MAATSRHRSSKAWSDLAIIDVPAFWPTELPTRRECHRRPMSDAHDDKCRRVCQDRGASITINQSQKYVLH